jgi:hypothetical protein
LFPGIPLWLRQQQSAPGAAETANTGCRYTDTYLFDSWFSLRFSSMEDRLGSSPSGDTLTWIYFSTKRVSLSGCKRLKYWDLVPVLVGPAGDAKRGREKDEARSEKGSFQSRRQAPAVHNFRRQRRADSIRPRMPGDDRTGRKQPPHRPRVPRGR